jgi:RNA recognition motif-containing protein
MTKSHSIFIGNLAYDVGDDLLKEMLDDVIGPGRYISVKRAVDHAGRAKGFAWATFATSEQAQHAVTQLHELEMNGRTLMVTLGRTETANNGASSSNNVQSRTEHVPNQTTTITSEPAGNI